MLVEHEVGHIVADRRTIVLGNDRVRPEVAHAGQQLFAVIGEIDNHCA